ncbi:hypothetical protein [Rhodoferax sp. GW822-FHT02A01]|uniref:hypothetical protein n=1 Tax=Rhodoferax sp. GW822-FHT02A01 TaxID=3141537 RepID=UPI00315CCBA1
MKQGALLRGKGEWLAAVIISVAAHSVVLLIWSDSNPLGSKYVNASASMVSMRLISSDLPPSPDIATSSLTQKEVQAIVQKEMEQSAPPISHPSEVSTIPSGDSVSGPYYFPVEQLTSKPAFLDDSGAPPATFIPDVMPLPVMVRIFINENGKVDRVVLSDNFLSEIARKLIVDSFTAMRFSPGILGTLAVKSLLEFEVKLDPTLPSQ